MIFMGRQYNPFGGLRRTPYGPYAVEYCTTDMIAQGKRACIYSRTPSVVIQPVISMADRMTSFVHDLGYSGVEKVCEIAPGSGAMKNGLKVVMQDAKKKKFDVLFLCNLNVLSLCDDKLFQLLVELTDMGIGVYTEKDGWINRPTQPGNATLLDNFLLCLT